MHRLSHGLAVLPLGLLGPLLIGSSLALSLMWYPAGNLFQVGSGDAADYRYIAEHFWGLPHDLSSYHYRFYGEEWGDFLSKVPFRDLGVGTYYMLIRIFQELSGVSIGIPTLYVWSVKLLLAASYLSWFFVCRRRFGSLFALCLLMPLIVPSGSWLLSEEVLSEGLLRACFVFILAMLLPLMKRHDHLWQQLVILGIGLICIHLKVQWILLAAFLWSAFAFHWLFVAPSRRALIVAAAAFLLLPASMLAIHRIGWGNASLSAGTGLHIAVLTDGASVRDVCGKHDDALPHLCSGKHKPADFWKVPLDASIPAAEYASFDRHSLGYLLQRPSIPIVRFLHGLALARNFPTFSEGDHAISSQAVRWWDAFLMIFTWIFLIAGLKRHDTRLLSAFGLGLWVVPAVGNMMTVSVIRYHYPMAGIPLIIAFIILWQLLRTPERRYGLELLICAFLLFTFAFSLDGILMYLV
jgi:hypothetical protein